MREDPDEDGESTLPDGEYVAVLDRFEGEVAVVLLERDGETVGDVAVSRDCLPEAARRADAVLSVTLDDGAVTAISYDEDATERRAERSQSRFDRLSRRLGDPDDEGRKETEGEDSDDEARRDTADGDEPS